ncbi:hypothetical protein D1094_18505, partial [Colwellia sp. RSH04]
DFEDRILQPAADFVGIGFFLGAAAGPDLEWRRGGLSGHRRDRHNKHHTEQPRHRMDDHRHAPRPLQFAKPRRTDEAPEFDIVFAAHIQLDIGGLRAYRGVDRSRYILAQLEIERFGGFGVHRPVHSDRETGAIAGSDQRFKPIRLVRLGLQGNVKRIALQLAAAVAIRRV